MLEYLSVEPFFMQVSYMSAHCFIVYLIRDISAQRYHNWVNDCLPHRSSTLAGVNENIIQDVGLGSKYIIQEEKFQLISM